MASYFTRSDSPYFWLRVKKPDGTWGKVNTAICKDDADAKRKLKIRQAKESLEEAKSASGNPKVQFDAWVPKFLAQHYEDPKSLSRAQNAWAALSAYLDYKKLRAPSQITHQHGHDYVAWRQKPPADASVKGRSKNTALTEIKIMSVIMQEAVRREWAAANPLFRLGIKRAPVKRKAEILLDEELIIERALKNEPQWMQDSWLIAMRQGCRLRETAVPLDDIDPVMNTIVFRGKKGKLHAAPLHRAVLEVYKRRRKERAEFLVDMPFMPSKAWFTFFRRLGLEHLSFHSTRVTVVTRLARSGASMSQAMAYVGHASETVHRIYQRMRPADVGHLGDVLDGPSAENPAPPSATA